MNPVRGAITANVAQDRGDEGVFCGDIDGWTTDFGEF